MKNILVIDGADNCVYDIYAVSDGDFAIIFPDGQDIEFIEDLVERVGNTAATWILNPIWKNRGNKKVVRGIHGTLFVGFTKKKPFYPTKRDEEARNLDGSLLRAES